jgi:predicted esterase
VQFCGEDQLFTKEGMHDADVALKSAFAKSEGNYKSDTFSVGHSFTVEMQNSAFDWLAEVVAND